jgi:hypothetical protein
MDRVGSEVEGKRV